MVQGTPTRAQMRADTRAFKLKWFGENGPGEDADHEEGFFWGSEDSEEGEGGDRRE